MDILFLLFVIVVSGGIGVAVTWIHFDAKLYEAKQEYKLLEQAYSQMSLNFSKGFGKSVHRHNDPQTNRHKA